MNENLTFDEKFDALGEYYNIESPQEIKDFLKDNEVKPIKKQEDVQLTFEYIDKKEKLMLPLFF